MDEEMARVFKAGEEAKEDSLMRKVSKTVSKHSRSFSDRGSRSSTTPKHRQNGSFEMSSPMSGSPRSIEDQLRHELHKANLRIRELESQNISLHERASRTMNIENADSEITKKRATITELETSQHMVLQELEIMENHLRNAKSQKNINMHQLQSSILQDLQRALEETKANIAKEVEELISQRNSVTEEITNLIQIKNKGMVEYESLSQKNLQLAELNNQLLQNIQETSRSKYKEGHGHMFAHTHNHSHGNSLDASRSPVGPNGLGIYTQHMKDKASEGAVDLRPVPSADTAHSSGAPTLVADADADPHVLTAPQVVNIRKGKPNKFNWKKGGEGLTKSVTKGIRGAFGGENRRPGKDAFEAGAPYGAMPSNQAVLEIGTPTNVMKNNVEMGKGGFGFFSGQKGAVKGPGMGPQGKSDLKGSGSGTNLAEMGSGKILFGSDLSLRCDYERMVIPTIITRCIEEVELRGMFHWIVWYFQHLTRF
jgi:Rho-type GTPase-activating protein 1/2